MKVVGFLGKGGGGGSAAFRSRLLSLCGFSSLGLEVAIISVSYKYAQTQTQLPSPCTNLLCPPSSKACAKLHCLAAFAMRPLNRNYTQSSALYIHLYIYIYTCMYTHTYIYIHVYVFIYMYTYASTFRCMCMCMYVCMYVCMHVCMYVCVCAYVCVHVPIWHIYIYAHNMWVHIDHITPATLNPNHKHRKLMGRLSAPESFCAW